MDKEFNLDNVLRASLKNDAENININNNSFNQLKKRIETTDRGISSILKKKLSDYKASVRFNTRKAITSTLCSLLIAFTLCGAAIPSVRAAAVAAVKNYVYLPIKNAMGGYETEKVPADQVEVVTLKVTRTTLSDEEISDELGYTVKLPQNLIDKYEQKEKWLMPGFKTSKNTFAAAIYKPAGTSEKAKLALSIMESSSEEYKVTKESSSSNLSKNQKELQIGDITAYYYENPAFKGAEELGKHGNPPEGFFESAIEESREILTQHAVHWEKDGVAYNLTDAGNNVSIEDITAIVEEIINNK